MARSTTDPSCDLTLIRMATASVSVLLFYTCPAAAEQNVDTYELLIQKPPQTRQHSVASPFTLTVASDRAEKGESGKVNHRPSCHLCLPPPQIPISIPPSLEIQPLPSSSSLSLANRELVPVLPRPPSPAPARSVRRGDGQLHRLHLSLLELPPLLAAPGKLPLRRAVHRALA